MRVTSQKANATPAKKEDIFRKFTIKLRSMQRCEKMARKRVFYICLNWFEHGGVGDPAVAPAPLPGAWHQQDQRRLLERGSPPKAASCRHFAALLLGGYDPDLVKFWTASDLGKARQVRIAVVSTPLTARVRTFSLFSGTTGSGLRKNKNGSAFLRTGQN